MVGIDLVRIGMGFETEAVVPVIWPCASALHTIERIAAVELQTRFRSRNLQAAARAGIKYLRNFAQRSGLATGTVLVAIAVIETAAQSDLAIGPAQARTDCGRLTKIEWGSA